MAKPARIVITGATGFVAKNLRRHLSAQKNVRLVSISRSDFAAFKDESKIVTTNYDDIPLQKIKDSDALVHLVGIGKQSAKADYATVNVELTRRIANLCCKANIKKIVYLSGLGVSPNTTLSLFVSKYKAEKIIAGSNLDYTIFRPSYIVGSNDYLTKYLKKQIRNHNVTIPGSGNYLIQPIHICDAVKVIYQSTHNKKFSDKIIDLVGPDPISFKQYVKLYLKQTGITISHINLEDAYHRAVTDSTRSEFGVDDLCILVGSFTGNHKRLQKISEIKFQSIAKFLVR